MEFLNFNFYQHMVMLHIVRTSLRQTWALN